MAREADAIISNPFKERIGPNSARTDAPIFWGYQGMLQVQSDAISFSAYDFL
jgi:hypothetical protein